MRSIVIWSRNHRRAAAVSATLLVVGVVGTGVILYLGNFAEKRRFAAVELGMSEEQVLAVIGMPPGENGSPGATYGRLLGYT